MSARPPHPFGKTTPRQKQEAIDAAFDHLFKNAHLGSLQFMHVDDERECVMVVDNLAAKREFESVVKKRMDIMIECKGCNSVPCVLDKDGLYDNLMTIGSSMEEEGYEPEKIRFALYQEAVRVIYGYLGKGVRKELPPCVVGDIRDAYPDPKQNYVGFNDGSSTVTVENTNKK